MKIKQLPSAIAAILHRKNSPDKIAEAEALLQEAEAQGHKRSYAGFRALARLSLACRMLEWKQSDRARGQVEDAARDDAKNMLDVVLKQERLDLVDQMGKWLTDFAENPSTITEAESLERVQNLTGMERNLYLEFLSAVYYPDADRLKQLLPLTLDDAITIDAVLGRLFSVLAEEKRPQEPFGKLITAMGLEWVIPDVMKEPKEASHD